MVFLYKCIGILHCLKKDRLFPRFWSNPLKIPLSMDDGQQGHPMTIRPVDETIALNDEFADVFSVGLFHPPTPAGKKSQGFGTVEAFLNKAPSGSGRMLAQIIPDGGQIGQGGFRPAQLSHPVNAVLHPRGRQSFLPSSR